MTGWREGAKRSRRAAARHSSLGRHGKAGDEAASSGARSRPAPRPPGDLGGGRVCLSWRARPQTCSQKGAGEGAHTRLFASRGDPIKERVVGCSFRSLAGAGCLRQ